MKNKQIPLFNLLLIIVGMLCLFIVGLVTINKIPWASLDYCCAVMGIICLTMGIKGKFQRKGMKRKKN